MVKEVNMDTLSTIKRLLGEYEKIRTENQREGQRREREIRQGFPAIAALLDERRDRLTGLKIVYVGDGNNVARSLLFASMKLGSREAAFQRYGDRGHRDR